MISRYYISCFILIMFLVTGVLAGDGTLPKGENSSLEKGSRQEKRYKLEEYVNDIPQYGDYYEWDGTRWQRYKASIPQHGSYLKEVKPEERGLEIKEKK